ncbi:MAG TPA: hypothetical protein PLV21_01175 [Cyclobacteriaceae bacterium]|mgnify:FL=1|nr:hypothetical protein [Cyclobacteriaceae bacterium]HRJ80466.1 hypothetical protein [Cyclobacteriaceae bacterium]
MKSIRSILLAVAAALPFVSLAHEGHGHEHPWSPGHFLANPEHSIPLVLAVALVTAFVVKRYVVAKRARKE